MATWCSLTGLNRILDVDLAGGRARVQAGVSLDHLMRALVPLGWWPVVSPGTRQVTVGGAIGSDVHGKEHHHDGTFTSHVESLVLETPALGTLTVGPGAVRIRTCSGRRPAAWGSPG